MLALSSMLPRILTYLAPGLITRLHPMSTIEQTQQLLLSMLFTFMAASFMLCFSTLTSDNKSKKIQEEKATGLLLVPKWPTQPWWPSLMQMLIQLPIQISRERDILFLPCNPQEPCKVGGAEAFRRQLLKSWNNPGC